MIKALYVADRLQILFTTEKWTDPFCVDFDKMFKLLSEQTECGL